MVDKLEDPNDPTSIITAKKDIAAVLNRKYLKMFAGDCEDKKG